MTTTEFIPTTGRVQARFDRLTNDQPGTLSISEYQDEHYGTVTRRTWTIRLDPGADIPTMIGSGAYSVIVTHETGEQWESQAFVRNGHAPGGTWPTWVIEGAGAPTLIDRAQTTTTTTTTTGDHA